MTLTAVSRAVFSRLALRQWQHRAFIPPTVAHQAVRCKSTATRRVLAVSIENGRATDQHPNTRGRIQRTVPPWPELSPPRPPEKEKKPPRRRRSKRSRKPAQELTAAPASQPLAPEPAQPQPAHSSQSAHRSSQEATAPVSQSSVPKPASPQVPRRPQSSQRQVAVSVEDGRATEGQKGVSAGLESAPPVKTRKRWRRRAKGSRKSVQESTAEVSQTPVPESAHLPLPRRSPSAQLSDTAVVSVEDRSTVRSSDARGKAGTTASEPRRPESPRRPQSAPCRAPVAVSADDARRTEKPSDKRENIGAAASGAAPQKKKSRRRRKQPRNSCRASTSSEVSQPAFEPASSQLSQSPSASKPASSQQRERSQGAIRTSQAAVTVQDGPGQIAPGKIQKGVPAWPSAAAQVSQPLVQDSAKESSAAEVSQPLFFEPEPPQSALHAAHESTAAEVSQPVVQVPAQESPATEVSETPDLDSAPLQLRPYQNEAITACLEALGRGRRRIGVSSPTGSGKTTMFMNLIPQVEFEQRKQVLVLVGSVELALQAEAAAKRILGDGYSVEVEQSKRIASGKADVTVATYQTLNNAQRLAKFNPDNFKLVIVDEAHHAAALSYLRLLHYFNEEVQLPPSTGPFSTFDHGNRVPVIGFSATFTRHDQLALSAAFEEIVFHRDVGHMLEEGWLAPVTSTTVYATLHLEDVTLTQKGDYSTTALARNVNTIETNSLIVRTWIYQASERRSTLVFAVNLRHVAALVDEFRQAGVDARSISAHTLPRERKETIAQFAAGDFPVLVNCEVLTEGTDIPEIDCIILARPTKSKNLLAQMVGRGLRLSPSSGKTDCYLLDIADNITRASGMTVAPTLFGLSAAHGMPAGRGDKGPAEDPGEAAKRPIADEAPAATIRKVTLVHNADPFGLEPEETPILAKMSPNAWVSCGNGRYILDLMERGFVAVGPEGVSQEGVWESGSELWGVSYTQRLPEPVAQTSAQFRRRVEISKAESLGRAIATGDKFAETRLGYATVLQLLRRNAEWRTRPASDKQIEMLMAIKGVSAERDDERQEIRIFGRTHPLSKLTRGQVSAYVTAARHGAVGRLRKQEAALIREEARRLRQLEKDSRNLPLPGV